MKKPPPKHIIIDGIAYDSNTGEVVGRSRSNSQLSPKQKHPEVLDLRTPENIVSPSQSAISKRQTQLSLTSLQNEREFYEDSEYTKLEKLKTTKEKLKKKIKVHTKRIKKSLIAPTTKSITNTPVKKTSKSSLSQDYLEFVLIKSIWPSPLFSLWQMSLIRTIVSPQTWLLLSLPVILLQLRILQNFTTNEVLQKAKGVVSPDHFSALAWSTGVALALFFIGVIFRSIISNAGIAIRLRQIDNRTLQLTTALRSAVHSMLRQAINYLLHLVIICLVTAFTMWVAITIFNSENHWVITSKYQLIVFLAVIWLVVLVLLYSKHWLQVGLLARSSKTSHLQLQSLKLLQLSPLRNFTTGLLAISGIFLGYSTILFIDWQITDFFITHVNSPTILVLIVVAILTVVILTTMQYYQQNTWARQYYFVASKATNNQELLYMEREKPASLWPLFVAIGFAGFMVGLYSIIVIWQSGQIKGVLANFHAEVPSQINFTLPVKE